jgi:hypothetical protein
MVIKKKAKSRKQPAQQKTPATSRIAVMDVHMDVS